MTKAAAIDTKPAPPKKGASASAGKFGAPSKTAGGMAKAVFSKSSSVVAAAPSSKNVAVALAKPSKTKPCVDWTGLVNAVANETVLSAGDPLFNGITLKKRRSENAGPGYSAGELPPGLMMEHNGKVYVTQEVASKGAKGSCTRWKLFSGK